MGVGASRSDSGHPTENVSLPTSPKCTTLKGMRLLLLKQTSKQIAEETVTPEASYLENKIAIQQGSENIDTLREQDCVLFIDLIFNTGRMWGLVLYIAAEKS